MYRRHSKALSYIIFGLIAIGLLVNIRSMILPLLIFGIIFYLYKFPPKQYQRGQKYNSGRPTARPQPKSKKSMFRVIKGNKKDDDEPPKFH
jgi:hypothetical protein